MKVQTHKNIRAAAADNYIKPGILIISIHGADLKNCILDKIKDPSKNYLSNVGLDAAIVYYGMFLRIEQKLLAEKLAGLRCNVSGGCFNIVAICDPSKTAARKIAGIIVRNMHPTGLGAYYKSTCRLLGMRPDSGTFAHYVNKIIDITNKCIDVFLFGKLADGFAEVLHNKCPTHAKMANPEKPIARDHIEPLPDIRIVDSKSSARDAVRAWAAAGSGVTISGKAILYYPNMEKIVQKRTKAYNAKKYNHKKMVVKAAVYGNFCVRDIVSAAK